MDGSLPWTWPPACARDASPLDRESQQRMGDCDDVTDGDSTLLLAFQSVREDSPTPPGLALIGLFIYLFIRLFT